MSALRLLLHISILTLLLVLLSSASLSTAQTAPDPLCSDLVTRAVETVGQACDGLSRNQACYGNQLIDVEFAPDQALVFVQSGDVVDLGSLRRISTTPYDGTAADWGIAVLKAQANLPDALPGQNVTFLLFGEASLDSPTPDMRAVTVQTSIREEVVCEQAPSGVLIQSPSGSQVEMAINGADVILGSTVYITADDEGTLLLATLDGAAVVTVFGVVRVVLPGYYITLPIDDMGQVSDLPSQTAPYDPALVRYLPLILLEEQIDAPEVTATRRVTPAATPTACARRADWTFRYSVQAGDTLSNIASRLGISTSSLQFANCIADPNLIRAGDSLNVPALVPTRIPTFTLTPSASPTWTPTPTPSATPPPAVTFFANPANINAGECATLFWNIGGVISSAFVLDMSVTAQGSTEYCPYETETISLYVIRPDESQEQYYATISVTDICGDALCGPTESFETCPNDCG